MEPKLENKQESEQQVKIKVKLKEFLLNFINSDQGEREETLDKFRGNKYNDNYPNFQMSGNQKGFEEAVENRDFEITDLQIDEKSKQILFRINNTTEFSFTNDLFDEIIQ